MEVVKKLGSMFVNWLKGELFWYLKFGLNNGIALLIAYYGLIFINSNWRLQINTVVSSFIN